MQLSPIQSRSIIYRRVHVAPTLDVNGNLDPQLKAPGFDWSEVKLGVETAIGHHDHENPTEFMASLRVTVTNEEGKRCPYELDFHLVALLQLSSALQASRREELAIVNGLAIAYGAMRELVVNLTSRMEYGALVLPGVNFQDQVQSGPPAAPTAGTGN